MQNGNKTEIKSYIDNDHDAKLLDDFKNGAPYEQIKEKGPVSDNLLIEMAKHDLFILEEEDLSERINKFDDNEKMDFIINTVFKYKEDQWEGTVTALGYFENVPDSVAVEAVKIAPEDWIYAPAHVQEYALLESLKTNPVAAVGELQQFADILDGSGLSWYSLEDGLSKDIRITALTHGMPDGQVNTKVLYRYKDLYPDEILDNIQINIKTREGMVIVETLNIEGSDEKADALESYLKEPSVTEISLVGITFDDDPLMPGTTPTEPARSNVPTQSRGEAIRAKAAQCIGGNGLLTQNTSTTEYDR